MPNIWSDCLFLASSSSNSVSANCDTDCPQSLQLRRRRESRGSRRNCQCWKKSAASADVQSLPMPLLHFKSIYLWGRRACSGVPLRGVQKKKALEWTRTVHTRGVDGTEEGLKLKPSAGNEAEELIIVHERQSPQRESWWLRVRGRMGPPWLEDGSHSGNTNYQWKSPPTPKS